MATPVTFEFSGAVEGPLDEAVLRVLLNHVGVKSGSIYGKAGKPYLRQKIAGYNHAAPLRIPGPTPRIPAQYLPAQNPEPC